MLMVVSPAKTLDFESSAPTELASKPIFLTQAQKIVEVMQSYDVAGLQKLMSVSEKIAILNVERFALWKKTSSLKQGKQAIYAFQGDVYVGLNAAEFNKKQQERAQQQLRILSGLYGVLKPMDIIMPYRLEMGTHQQVHEAANLYEFWKADVTRALNKDIEETKSKFLLNLASIEYFKAVDTRNLSVPVVSPEFKDFKNGKYKIISFYAKKARGMMAQYVIQNNVKTLDDLLEFNTAGYKYSPEMSKDNKPVFIRAES